jgi:hypothetical protein
MVAQYGDYVALNVEAQEEPNNFKGLQSLFELTLKACKLWILTATPCMSYGRKTGSV